MRPATRSRCHVEALVALGFLAFSVFATWPLAAHVGTRVPANLGDPLETVWIFGAEAHNLAHHALHLFDGNMYAPERLTLAFTENMLGMSAIAAPIVWLTGNAVLAVNLTILAVFAVSAYGASLLAFELTRDRAVSILAGAAFGFAPFRINQVGHLHVIATHLLPFVLVLLLHLHDARPRRTVPALALLIAWQWWSSLTGGALTLVAIACWGLWEVSRNGRSALPTLKRAGLATAIAGALVVPVLVPYAIVRHDHPEFSHSPQEVLDGSAKPASYLWPPGRRGPLVRGPSRFLAAHFGQTPPTVEKRLFPGFWLTAVSACSAGALGFSALRRRRRRRAWPHWAPAAALGFVIAAAGFTLSLGPRLGARPDGLRLPFAVVNRLVPGSLTRVPARLGVLALLGMAIAAAAVLSGLGDRARRAVLIVSAIVLVGELAPPGMITVAPPKTTSAHRAVAAQPGAVLGLPTVEVGADGALVAATFARETQHMYLSLANHRPLLNGWGAFAPASSLEVTFAVQSFPSDESFAFLAARHVSTVVVQTDLIPGTPWQVVDRALDAWPGVRLLAEGKGVRVYDITRER